MEITKSSIEDLLNNLVKPMFDVIVKIEVVSLRLFDGIASELYPVIDIIFDKETYLTIKDTNEFDYIITQSITDDNIIIDIKYPNKFLLIFIVFKFFCLDNIFESKHHNMI
jgi:hypothetical protein